MNYSAYAPLAKLRAVLEEKGFCKKRDRPTILQVWIIVQNESFFVTLTPGLCDTRIPQVIKVYFILPIIWLCQDLSSRSLRENFTVYIVGR
jgi:hypothetical protein